MKAIISWVYFFAAFAKPVCFFLGGFAVATADVHFGGVFTRIFSVADSFYGLPVNVWVARGILFFLGARIFIACAQSVSESLRREETHFRKRVLNDLRQNPVNADGYDLRRGEL
ncbi:hypothetical protein [Pseudodesulfovibrio pelocollis]|uniref:hypothetical protein n=1 Tax=Pseudodesulfovibrio pelocollis TaxID=3051432 RepID=UPI00255AFB41|nr:hypothetical protein [Pseudodesulfovibrio sp. SB368]